MLINFNSSTVLFKRLMSQTQSNRSHFHIISLNCLNCKSQSSPCQYVVQSNWANDTKAESGFYLPEDSLMSSHIRQEREWDRGKLIKTE